MVSGTRKSASPDFLLWMLFARVIVFSKSAAAELRTAIQGFNRLYHLDFSGARQGVDAWEKLHPGGPMGRCRIPPIFSLRSSIYR
jgi:hypothetical protein